jgi:ferredoxin
LNTKVDGRLTIDHLTQLCSDYRSRNVYICGPSAMIGSTKELLIDNNVSKEQIHYEYFGAPPVYDLNIENKGEIFFKQSVIKTATSNKQTLLQLAESSGLKPANGCRMGVCHQCVCKKKQGVIYNTLTNTFSDSGEQDIQICVSIAVGDVTLEL